MVACVSSQLKRSGFSILSCEKGLDLQPRTFFTDKNGELLGLYPILITCFMILNPYPAKLNTYLITNNNELIS